MCAHHECASFSSVILSVHWSGLCRSWGPVQSKWFVAKQGAIIQQLKQCCGRVPKQIIGCIYCKRIPVPRVHFKFQPQVFCVFRLLFVSILDLLSRLLTKAFENYDMENIITAFLIVRQAALEGPAVFMPYAEWFKVRIKKKKTSWEFCVFLSVGDVGRELEGMNSFKHA